MVVEEETNPVIGEEEETSTDSSTEENDTTETSQDDNTEEVPYHKNPRWIAREQKLREYEERDAQRESEMAELKAFKEEMEERMKTEDVNIPEEFRAAFGDDVNPDAVKAIDSYFDKKLSAYEETKAEKATREQQEQEQEVQKFNEWTDNQIADLEASGEVFDKDALIKVMIDNSEPDALYNVFDKDGKYDFRKGLRVLEMTGNKNDTTDAKKSVSDKTRGTGEAGKKDFVTWAETRKMGWR